jgi:hypothetical protein
MMLVHRPSHSRVHFWLFSFPERPFGQDNAESVAVFRLDCYSIVFSCH